MTRSIQEVSLRLLLLLLGLCVAHLGVTLFLLSDLGADPFNVFIQGLFRTLKTLTGWSFLTHGYIHMAICFFIMLLLLLVHRAYIKIGTLVCMFFGGPIIDGFTWLLGGYLHSGTPLPLRFITLALGCVILSFGMTIVMKSDAGVGPNDLVAIALSDGLHTPFGRTRIVVDVLFVVVGFLLGGAVGLGTVICAFLVGPVAAVFLPIQERWIGAVLKRCG